MLANNGWNSGWGYNKLVITDEERKIKMVCVDPHDIPIIAIVDTELMASMPKMDSSTTGLDALTHAVEGYIIKSTQFNVWYVSYGGN